MSSVLEVPVSPSAQAGTSSTTSTSEDSIHQHGAEAADRPNPTLTATTTTTKLPYRNNASLIAPVRVDVSASSSVRDQQITRALRLIRPDLFDRTSHTSSNASSSDGGTHAHHVTIRQLGGGLSNHLYVAHPGEPDEAILVRIHAEDEGHDVDDDQQRVTNTADAGVLLTHSASELSTSSTTFVDRDVENRVLAWLSSIGLAPTFHGRFANGRIEEFFDGYRPLSWDELAVPKFAVPIARAMADLHGVEPPMGILDISEEQRQEGEIWSRIADWFEMACNTGEGEESDDDLQRSMLNEWEWLKEALRHPFTAGSPPATPFFTEVGLDDIGSTALAFFRQIVFTHMDCQSLNILTPCDGFQFDSDFDTSGHEATSLSTARDSIARVGISEGDATTIRLIDFEYAGLNSRATDIANTFCEHCNMNNLSPKYEEQYPTEEQQDTFLRAYTTAANLALSEQLSLIENGWETFLAVAKQEVGMHTLLSHIGWSIWAVAQADLSTIEFDYRTYAKLRMDGYYHFKDRYWSGN